MSWGHRCNFGLIKGPTTGPPNRPHPWTQPEELQAPGLLLPSRDAPPDPQPNHVVGTVADVVGTDFAARQAMHHPRGPQLSSPFMLATVCLGGSQPPK